MPTCLKFALRSTEGADLKPVQRHIRCIRDSCVKPLNNNSELALVYISIPERGITSAVFLCVYMS